MNNLTKTEFSNYYHPDRQMYRSQRERNGLKNTTYGLLVIGALVLADYVGKHPELINQASSLYKSIFG